MNLSNSYKGVSSKELRNRVEVARHIQKQRFKGMGINCNAQMSTSYIKEYCKIEEDSKKLLQLAYDRFKYSARTFHKFLKVARTFADMDGSNNIRKQDIAKVLMCRDHDKEQAKTVEL
jgi:magnesium chelatase family protein